MLRLVERVEPGRGAINLSTREIIFLSVLQVAVKFIQICGGDYQAAIFDLATATRSFPKAVFRVLGDQNIGPRIDPLTSNVVPGRTGGTVDSRLIDEPVE